jgi:S1-C subfamily serine protease
VTGRVVDAKDSGRLHVPARLSVALSSVEVDGKTYDIETNTIRKTGKNHNKRNLAFIGGGTAGGALNAGPQGGPAGDAGIRPGDIILEIDGHGINTVKDFQTAVGRLKKEEFARLLIKRQGATLYLTVEVPK